MRKAKGADREFLYDLHVATMRDYVARTWGWDDAAQRQMFDERFDPSKVDLLELDGRPIGMQMITEEIESIELGNIAFDARALSSGIPGGLRRRATYAAP